MKINTLLVAVVLMAACGGKNSNEQLTSAGNDSAQTKTTKQPADMPSIHSFTVKDIEGKDFSFASLKGKKVMIVNTASECGLTPQYENLQHLYEQYKDSNFVIIGFPANNFGAQEPGTNQEIATFCSSKFHVTFPMMEKVSVKGMDIAPIYEWLTKKEKNGVEDVEMMWNFQKFLIDEDGHFVKTIHPQTLPDDPSVTEWITKK